MQLHSSETADGLIVHVDETRIDAACAIDFKEAMRKVTAQPTAKVILDLSKVGFIDSSGLGAVVAVRKMLGPDRALELACLSPSVEKVFRLTRMDRIFAIHETVPVSHQRAM
ncbi:STAS domain-containing protein [Thioclava sp. FR2]|uniref:STAS domain-containing protein n=1 Tax=Thioclava sp. FR2 TaxID=3445780 RepID=UPI003EBDD421